MYVLRVEKLKVFTKIKSKTFFHLFHLYSTLLISSIHSLCVFFFLLHKAKSRYTLAGIRTIVLKCDRMHWTIELENYPCNYRHVMFHKWILVLNEIITFTDQRPDFFLIWFRRNMISVRNDAQKKLNITKFQKKKNF